MNKKGLVVYPDSKNLKSTGFLLNPITILRIFRYKRTN